MSFAKFEREFKLSVKKAMKAAEKTIREAAIELFTDIIKDTPVGDPSIWKSNNVPSGYVGGQLRGNWQTTLNTPAASEINRLQRGGNGPATQETKSGTAGYDLKDTIYFANQRPYAGRVEDGWSTQAPVGMVKTNIIRWNRIVEARARKNRT